jgi:hypothetical protein
MAACRSCCRSLLLVIGVWVRLSLQESPLFRRLKLAGGASRAPLTEALRRWRQPALALIALFGLVAGQAVVWYTGQFQALFFLTLQLKVRPDTREPDGLCCAGPVCTAVRRLRCAVGSHRRKPIILAGGLLAALAYWPLFGALTVAANPALAEAQQRVTTTLVADPVNCGWRFERIFWHEQRRQRLRTRQALVVGSRRALRRAGRRRPGHRQRRCRAHRNRRR